ncbi:hypothetical protein DFH28DRAFT_934466 [Melampsora americana]|nr:hypothetical protein DFH28DRAFT_934466 [Melampsora americana]
MSRCGSSRPIFWFRFWAALNRAASTRRQALQILAVFALPVVQTTLSRDRTKRETSSERRARKKEEKASRKLEGRSERRSLREEEDRRAAAGLSVDLNFSVHLHH